MDFSRILDILRICIPVFGLIGLGHLIQRRSLASREALRFLNNLCYFIALPCLILAAVATQPFKGLLNVPLIGGTLFAVAVLIVLSLVVVRLGRHKGGLGAIMIFGTYWANASYIGFPLAENAFGKEGLALAAIVNAFTMPVFVMSGFLLIKLSGHGNEGPHGKLEFKDVVLNPVVGASLLGVLIAFVRDAFQIGDRPDLWAVGLSHVSLIALSFLKLTGTMGLPLALISVGASLNRPPLSGHYGPLAYAVAGKLLLAPLITILFIRLVFPEAPHRVYAVASLLMATPNAVGSYIVCTRLQVEEHFMGTLLVFSTLLSVVTIPVWLYFLL